jgi:hypothetical protein
MLEYRGAPWETIVPLSNDLVPLVLFVALILAAALYGLAVSGHFPQRPKDTVFASRFGAFVLLGSMALVALGLIGGSVAALHFVPWYAAIIGAGCALLAAPPALSQFPDRFVDGRGAPIAFAGISAALAILLIGLVIGIRCPTGTRVSVLPNDGQTADRFGHGECH